MRRLAPAQLGAESDDRRRALTRVSDGPVVVLFVLAGRRVVAAVGVVDGVAGRVHDDLSQVSASRQG